MDIFLIISQHLFLAHLSRWAHEVSLLYTNRAGVRPSVVRPSVCPPCSKIFFSKTARPIKAKFYVEPPWESGTKVCINGHISYNIATLIFSSPEPLGSRGELIVYQSSRRPSVRRPSVRLSTIFKDLLL